MLKLQAWLADYWVIGAGFMAASLIAAAPIVALPLPVFLIFLHSPVYMVHQVEEHTGDRFRKFANEHVFGGRDALTVASVLVTNLPFVWGINLLALYAAFLWGPAWGLVAPLCPDRQRARASRHVGATAQIQSRSHHQRPFVFAAERRYDLDDRPDGRSSPALDRRSSRDPASPGDIVVVTARYRSLVASS